jgi:hypothetical protein
MYNINSTAFFSFIVIEVQLDSLTLFLENDYSYELEKGEFNIQKSTMDIKSIVSSRRNGGSHLSKAIFFESTFLKGKTIMISNSFDGWITLANHIVSLTKNNHLAFFTSTKIDTGLNENYMFIKRSHDEDVRIVYSMTDSGKWVFYQEGEILGFEDISNYSKRKIKDRLNFSIIVDYCNKLGFDILNQEFWSSNKKAIYLEETELNRKH